MAKQLYDYWFVQFDFPNQEGKPYKSNGGVMIFDSIANRHVPLDWDVVRMKDRCETYLGGTPSTENQDYWGGPYPWLNSGEVAEFPIVTSEKTITQKGLDNSATSFLKAGSVTLSITRHLRPSIMAIDACINQSVVGIAENETFKHSYLYPLIAWDIPRLMKLRTGAQQPHISKEVVDNIPLVVPPTVILQKYYENVEPIYSSIFNNAKQILELQKQRDELLPLLMNGQVSVTQLNSDLALTYKTFFLFS